MCSLGISTLFFPVQGRHLQNSVVMKKLCPSPQPSNKSAMWVLYAPGSPVKEEALPLLSWPVGVVLGPGLSAVSRISKLSSQEAELQSCWEGLCHGPP